MTEVIIAICGIVVGAVGAFFVLKNNPKFLNVDKMLTKIGADKLAELKAKVDSKVKEITDKVKDVL